MAANVDHKDAWHRRQQGANKRERPRDCLGRFRVFNVALASIFRAARLGLVEVVLAGLWG